MKKLLSTIYILGPNLTHKFLNAVKVYMTKMKVVLIQQYKFILLTSIIPIFPSKRVPNPSLLHLITNKKIIENCIYTFRNSKYRKSHLC